jgi:hypothetical protein
MYFAYLVNLLNYITSSFLLKGGFERLDPTWLVALIIIGGILTWGLKLWAWKKQGTKSVSTLNGKTVNKAPYYNPYRATSEKSAEEDNIGLFDIQEFGQSIQDKLQMGTGMMMHFNLFLSEGKLQIHWRMFSGR